MTKQHFPATIRAYMTASPLVIAPSASMTKAHELMRRNQIRHLPVMRGGGLVGVVSQRDLAVMESLPGVDPDEVPVEDAMTADVFTVSPDAPLRYVVDEMNARKLGSAVIMEAGAVVGVFTTIDALQALALVMGALEPR